MLFGLNEEGHETGVDDMVAGNTLGLVQDTESADASGAWGAEYRDVVILDGDNHVVTAFNLTTHDLSDPDHYEALRTLLIDTAQAAR